MTITEYKNLVESLYVGHEFSFNYNNKTYFLERTSEGHELYDISDLKSESKTNNIVFKTNNGNAISSVNDFLEKKIFGNFSFNEIYDKVEILYIE